MPPKRLKPVNALLGLQSDWHLKKLSLRGKCSLRSNSQGHFVGRYRITSESALKPVIMEFVDLASLPGLISRRPLLGIQRAAQSISQSILSGIGDHGRPSDFTMRTGNDGSVEINLSVSLLEMRDNQFRRLQRQTNQLLNLAMQDGRSPTDPRSGPSVSEDADAEPQGDRTEQASGELDETSVDAAVSATSPQVAEGASATTAHSEVASGSSGANEDAAVARPSDQRQPEVTLARLAEMLSEQRRLWREMEPQLDRWEAMLRTEQATHEAAATCDSSSQPPKAATDSIATPSSSGEEAMDVEQDFVDPVASTATDVTPKEHVDEVAVASTDSSSGSTHEWNQSFFNQISGLLHLHAHMLHLLSDFAVGTPNRSARTAPAAAESAASSTNAATEQSGTQTCTTNGATTESPSAPARGTPMEDHSATSTQARPHRVVIAPEYGGQIVHAHINIEPTTVTIAQPISTVSAGSGVSRAPAVSVLTPASQTTLIDTDSSGTLPNRRRSQSARPMPATTIPPTTSRAYVWTSPSDLVINSASAANSLLSQTFLHLRHNLHAGGYLSSPSPTSDMHMHNCIDGLRRPLRHILPPNYVAERDAVRDRLIDLLLSSRLRDLLVLQDSSQNPEADLVDWASKRARSVNSEPVDIRQSLLAFLTPRVMNQMTLWSQSPTNSGFGSLLALTLNQMALDLFGFADLLSATAAERLGLRLEGRENASSATGPGGGRSQIFGHTMSYEPLLQHLDAFASTLGADSDDRRVLIIIRAGLVDSLSRYCSLGSHGLNRYVGAPLSFITYRALSGTPAPLSTPESGGAGQSEADLTSATKAEDSDASDMYEDACDTVVEATPSVASQAVPTVADTGVATGSSLNKRHKLPEWKPASGEVPGSIAEALSTNPQSPGLVFWNASLSGDGTTVDGLPRQWLQLVSRDVASMNAQPTHAAGPAVSSASSSPEFPASLHEHGVPEEVTSSEYRLSDAYVSGMPAKRRKVMLEKKGTLLCPIQNMFSNLLNEAVLAAEAPNPGAGQLSAPPVGGLSAAAAAATAGAASIQPPAPPVNPGEVTDALKTYVSNHLSKRLTTDADFDPARFPKAAEVFLKPKVKK
nr:unnamed protein product [Spirometra erinaceieuropaei]